MTQLKRSRSTNLFPNCYIFTPPYSKNKQTRSSGDVNCHSFPDFGWAMMIYKSWRSGSVGQLCDMFLWRLRKESSPMRYKTTVGPPFPSTNSGMNVLSVDPESHWSMTAQAGSPLNTQLFWMLGTLAKYTGKYWSQALCSKYFFHICTVKTN